MANSADPDQLASSETSWWWRSQLMVKKPTDLDLHGLRRQGISGFSRTRALGHLTDSKMAAEIYLVMKVVLIAAEFSCCIECIEGTMTAWVWKIFSLHEMSNSIFWEKSQVKYFIMKTRPLNILALFMAAQMKSFRWKKCYLFVIFAQNKDCGYSLELPHWGSSNRYPQSMFYSRNKKNNIFPCKPHFFLYKSGV